MKKLAEFLLNNKTNVRSFFKNIIYNHELPESYSFDAIKLQFFLKELKKVDINVDTIAMYCLFEKLKFSEQIESIDVKKLIDEIKIYGVTESNNKNEENPKIEEFFYKIGKFLKEKNCKLLEFLEGKITKIDVDNQIKECISVLEFSQLLTGNNIITDIDLIKNILKLFKTEYNEYIIIEKLKSSLEFYYKKAIKNKEKKDISNKKINIDDLDSNEIPNADSKVFSDTLKSEKQLEDEKMKLIQPEKQIDFKKFDDDMDFIQELSHEDSSRSIIILSNYRKFK